MRIKWMQICRTIQTGQEPKTFLSFFYISKTTQSYCEQ